MTTIPNHLDISTARTTYIASAVERAFADREYRPNSRSDDAEVVFVRKEAAAEWDVAEGKFLDSLQYLEINGYEDALEQALDNFTHENDDLFIAVHSAFQETLK